MVHLVLPALKPEARDLDGFWIEIEIGIGMGLGWVGYCGGGRWNRGNSGRKIMLVPGRAVYKVVVARASITFESTK